VFDRLFASILFVFVSVSFIGGGSVSSAADKPNVVIVITDDQGYGDLSCHGNPVLKTPQMDAAACRVGAAGRLPRRPDLFTDAVRF
jgi:hypothetical protein